MKHPTDEIKKVRDESIIDAELALGASEFVLERLHALQKLFHARFAAQWKRPLVNQAATKRKGRR